MRIEAPSNKPRNPPTYENREIDSDENGKKFVNDDKNLKAFKYFEAEFGKYCQIWKVKKDNRNLIKEKSQK